ncbi:MAG TPA: hypothetical protein VIN58_23200 [Roseateles sp.]
MRTINTTPAAWLMAIALATWATHAGATPQDEQVAAVRTLYARYAAESVIDDTDSPTLATAPRAVLRQHLTEELTRLWLRDRDCVQRTREICRIDFAVIWDSQDPTGTSVKLAWDPAQGRVAATLRRADGSTRVLAYSLVKGATGWRIADIGFGDGRPSLRQLLMVPRP